MITTRDLIPAGRLTGQTAMAAALADFERRYPAYARTAVLDDMRARDYARLDAAGHVYLDYTGGGLYADSQLARHRDLLARAVFGNPHSQNLPSREATAQVEATRAQILEFFRASPQEYEVIFTPNATGALRLVGESYPFGPGGRFLLTFDNHNSVNGIRQFARAKGASVSYVPLTPADLRVSQETLARHLQAAAPAGRRRFGRRRSGPAARNLFAFPAQSNFSGVQHPLAWIAQAQAAGYDVLLDAAAFAPANRLDLSRWHPDYVSLSFYKIFGYPTGIGALLARRPALAGLRRPWYAGGTITFSSVRAEATPGEGFYLTPGPAGFEDGTVDYLGIPAIGIGLDHISSVGIETVHTRVMCLTGWLLEALGALRHSNGAPVVRIYGPAGTDRRGATIAMNFFDPSGILIDSVRVERRANMAGISLRSGCHCNPGVREVALGYSAQEMAAAFKDKDRLRYQEFLQVIDGKTTGAARASIGLATTFADVYRFWEFAARFRDLPSDAVEAPSGPEHRPPAARPDTAGTGPGPVPGRRDPRTAGPARPGPQGPGIPGPRRHLPADAVSRRARILVLGAGRGGLELSATLSSTLGPDADITLIDKADGFMFGFSKLDIMFGKRRPAEVFHPYRAIDKPGLRFVQATISSIDPQARRVDTNVGSFAGDIIVVALGADLDPAATPGLAEAGHEFYTNQGAFAARDVLARFGGGRVIVGVTSTPFTCPPAPSETALLLHDYLTARGLRRHSAISLVMPLPAPIPPSLPASAALLAAFAERGIAWYPDRGIDRLDPGRKVAVFSDGTHMPYDLFLGVPRHQVPSAVQASGLAAGGWVPVNPLTLETEFPDVYALGEVTSMGAAKAGAFSEGQALVAASQIISRLRGTPGAITYDGRGTCYLEFGRNLVGRVSVTFPPGQAPSGDLEGPSQLIAADKADFAANRIQRWFDHPPDHGQGSSSKPQRKLGAATGVR